MANEVKITITGKDGVSQTFVAIGRNADQMGQKVEQGAQKSARSMKQWNEAAFAVGATIGALALATSKMAGDAEASNARMAQSFENAGLAVEDYRTQLNELTEKGLQLAFDDEDVQDAIASLVDVTGSAEEAFRDLAIAQDVARARQIDLASATRLVIAAETGRYQSLIRMGIAVDSTMTSEEALAAVQGKYAGQAEAYAETTAASYERLQNSIENFGESVGSVANKALVPILALSAAAPAITSLGGAIAGIGGGSAGIAALGAALGTVGVAAVALAAPVGIATYLILDQSNVMARATEETLKNKQALEGYIAYLESIDTPAEFIPEMSQDMKELLDWVTKVGDGIDTGLIQASATTGAFSTNLGELDDTIRRLDPANLEAVKILAEQLGVSFTDPATWNPDAINALSNYIVNLSRAQTDATYDALELSRATQSLKTDVYEAAVVMDDAAVSVAYLNTQMAVSEDTWLGLQDLTKGAAVGLERAAEGAEAATENVHAMTVAIDELGASLKDANPAVTLDRTFKAIVGNTNAMVGSIDTAKKWADALIAPVGIYSELDTMLTNEKISSDEYKAAQEAQTQITEDYTRALEASQVIQAKQAPLIAEQTDATADYLENLSQLPEQEQMLALAWADQDLAGRATSIADMAANYDQMSGAQQEAFNSLITEAAAADPVLAAMLEKMGLISIGADGTITINTDSLGGAQDQMDDLTDAIRDLADVIGKLLIDYSSADNASGVLGVIATQMANLDGTTATVYVNGVQVGFIPGDAGGGIAGYAGGGLVRLAEMDPELLQFASGGVAIAPTDGIYSVPANTYVTPAAPTADRMGGRSGGGITITGNVYVYPATPDLHDAISSTVLRGGLR